MRTAAALHVHRNTVLYRLGSIERLLGRELGPSPLGDEAVERFRKANDVFARQLLKLWHDHGNYGADHFYDTDKTMANGNALVGLAETVAAKLAAQVGQAPVNYFEATPAFGDLTLAFGDLTLAEATANLTAFAETVMPAVRAAFRDRGTGERPGSS